MEKNRY